MTIDVVQVLLIPFHCRQHFPSATSPTAIGNRVSDKQEAYSFLNDITDSGNRISCFHIYPYFG